jgi:hypothetical protein
LAAGSSGKSLSRASLRLRLPVGTGTLWQVYGL